MTRLMYGDTARPCEVDHTAARKWWWYTAFTLRNSEIRTGLGVLCASSSFSLKVTWMMYINQSMTSNVLAISAITIVLLFLQRQAGQLQNSHEQRCTCVMQQQVWLMQRCNLVRKTSTPQRLWPHEQRHTGQQQYLPMGQGRNENMDGNNTVEASPAQTT